MIRSIKSSCRPPEACGIVRSAGRERRASNNLEGTPFCGRRLLFGRAAASFHRADIAFPLRLQSRQLLTQSSANLYDRARGLERCARSRARARRHRMPRGLTIGVPRQCALRHLSCWGSKPGASFRIACRSRAAADKQERLCCKLQCFVRPALPSTRAEDISEQKPTDEGEDEPSDHVGSLPGRRDHDAGGACSPASDEGPGFLSDAPPWRARASHPTVGADDGLAF